MHRDTTSYTACGLNMVASSAFWVKSVHFCTALTFEVNIKRKEKLLLLPCLTYVQLKSLIGLIPDKCSSEILNSAIIRKIPKISNLQCMPQLRSKLGLRHTGLQYQRGDKYLVIKV